LHAIKFPDTGFVRLVVKPVGDVRQFEVHDSGAGIDEQAGKAFGKVFYQVDSSATVAREAWHWGSPFAAVCQKCKAVTKCPASSGKAACFTLTLPHQGR